MLQRLEFADQCDRTACAASDTPPCVRTPRRPAPAVRRGHRAADVEHAFQQRAAVSSEPICASVPTRDAVEADAAPRCAHRPSPCASTATPAHALGTSSSAVPPSARAATISASATWPSTPAASGHRCASHRPHARPWCASAPACGAIARRRPAPRPRRPLRCAATRLVLRRRPPRLQQRCRQHRRRKERRRRQRVADLLGNQAGLGHPEPEAAVRFGHQRGAVALLTEARHSSGLWPSASLASRSSRKCDTGARSARKPCALSRSMRLLFVENPGHCNVHSPVIASRASRARAWPPR